MHTTPVVTIFFVSFQIVFGEIFAVAKSKVRRNSVLSRLSCVAVTFVNCVSVNLCSVLNSHCHRSHSCSCFPSAITMYITSRVARRCTGEKARFYDSLCNAVKLFVGQLPMALITSRPKNHTTAGYTKHSVDV